MPHSSERELVAVRTALRAAGDVRPPFTVILAALILGLLARLIRRVDAAWTHFPLPTAPYDEDEDESEFAYTIPFVSRAIHAICVEAGLVPGWIFAGRPCRGMRALPNRTRTPTRTLPARAPPVCSWSYA